MFTLIRQDYGAVVGIAGIVVTITPAGNWNMESSIAEKL
jgi:hypothetical protein